MMIQVRDLSFKYGKLQVLKRIGFEVEEGRIVSLVGANGAGKSTLLKCMNRILKPSSGDVSIAGRSIGQFHLKDIARHIGYVPQNASPAFASTVMDTVLLGRRPHVSWVLGSEDRDFVYAILIAMRLDHLAHRVFNEISGGEQQRTLIARALAQNPRVLLLDEPTSSLDLRHQLEVMDHVTTICKQKGVSVIMAIHDLNLAARYSDRLIFLKQGEIFQDGAPRETLIPANILHVYGVEAGVSHDFGKPHIVPLGVPVNGSF